MSTVPSQPMATPSVLERYAMALDEINRKLVQITTALNVAGVPYAIVGGQAVIIWVSTIDPDAVRTTKDVDLMIHRTDLPKACAAASTVDMEYVEILNVGMFVDRKNPNPRKAVHLVWAEEKVKPDNPLPAPSVSDRQMIETGLPVVSLRGLVTMKLMANRDHDRTHLRDMIGVGLIDRSFLEGLPPVLAERLDAILTDPEC
jgi:hypothetical protein